MTVDGETVGRDRRRACSSTSASPTPTAPAEVAWLARKVWELRILRDERSASDLGAPILVVSQFTLYGDARKGRRPTWQAAAPREVSEPPYDAFCAELERLGATVARGVFGGGHAGRLGQRRPGHPAARGAVAMPTWRSYR